MALGFSGEVTDFYRRYRRGYPEPVIDEIVAAFGLTGADVALDLGCGTGQLALPLAGRVRAVIGMDPEPDMLVQARSAAAERSVANTGWLLGGDTDVHAVKALLGKDELGAVTIGQALHWMSPDELFPKLAGMTRTGGGVAVVTNGEPLWLQDNDWSRALRDQLTRWLGTSPARTCGTDRESQLRYAESLATAGFSVHTTTFDHAGELSVEEIVGGVYSALPVDKLPPRADRAGFARRIDDALRPHAPFVEHVRVRTIFGRRTR